MYISILKIVGNGKMMIFTKKHVIGRNFPFPKFSLKVLYNVYIYFDGVMTSETYKCTLFRLPFKSQLSNQTKTRMFCGAVYVHDLPG